MARNPRKTKAKQPAAVEQKIEATQFDTALSERYLSYALSTIMHRALPDVRDGLKPVHRRLLFAMRQLKLDPNSSFKKSARVVGDVIGKFHPHGDQAVYDALVRLAQQFAVRYPLIDGQGNFGNIDGDNAAAMRYTEARLTAVADALLNGIDEDTVDFRETYDGEEEEPDVLPSAFPNLLANGANGIAVGMATSIPPHNAGELADALLHLIKFPNATIKKLVELVPGPDFPTGGEIVEPQDSIIEAYKTGRGGFRLRARWETEDLGRGQWQIVVSEIPYQVQKAKLIEKIAELITSKRLPILADVHDESAEDIRVVLTPKSRTVEPQMLMEQLFRLTDLEVRVPLNLNVLDGNHVPRVMSLKEALTEFLDHRRVVLIRRSKNRLDKIERRLEILDGYLIAYLNLDEIIRIIREEDEPKKVMMKKFKLTDIQAEAILNMRLRALRKLEEEEIKTEHKTLSEERKGLKALLKSKDKQWKVITDETKAMKKAFGADDELGRRRSSFGVAEEVKIVPLEAMIEKEPVTIVCSQKGWIRTVKGHLEDDAALRFKEGDGPRFSLHAQTTDKLLIFATNGRFYTLGVDKLPGGRGHGEPVRLMMDLGNEHDLTAMKVHEPEGRLLVLASDARGFTVKEADVVAQTKNGKQVLNVKAPVEAQLCVSVPEGADHIAIIGENRRLLLFPLADVPEMGRGRGVRFQKYRDGGVSDATLFNLKEGLNWTDAAGRAFNVTELRDWLGKRDQAGRLPPKGFPKSNKFGRR